jgi:hypothetical protein
MARLHLIVHWLFPRFERCRLGRLIEGRQELRTPMATLCWYASTKKTVKNWWHIATGSTVRRRLMQIRVLFVHAGD